MKRLILLLITLTLAGQLSAESYRILHSFGDSSGDGYASVAGLALDGGTLYGTTISGGKGGNGTLFKLSTDGTGFTNVHNFSWSDGANPGAGVVCSDGVLYGTTESGGDTGNGTVFKVNTDGSGHTVIKSFPALVPEFFGTNSDGAKPRGDLVLDGNTLFGTTFFGGAAGNGTVFKINTDGSDFTVLQTFSATFQGTNNVSGNVFVHGTNTDGANPIAGLTLAGDTLYGTTFYGGVFSNGVIFKIQKDGSGFGVLRYFPPLVADTNGFGTNSDGANAWAGVALSGDELYEMTVNGENLYDGTLFKLKTNGDDYVVLKHYLSADGAFPHTAPIVSGDTLYGTTFAGGDTNRGTIFKVHTDGSNYTVFKSLNPTDGFYSYSRFVLSGSTLYGTTDYGGTHGNGVVFAFGVPPEILTAEGGFGVQSNAFGFNVSGISNQVVVIEACSNLTGVQWVPLQTNVLGNAAIHFSDPHWTNYPGRFYRARTP
jgi:uncharacterized repeat protein (TIGR03803 family)